ncbi:hypothetical protein FIBSPDRAFT_851454 [Athelia psychrophila]|uniref:Uncharacterized protein n=1 Tax=Athelia psychrophila TaxID=1759441 RepID=A0A167UID8_9AGAM|nr:hypothetical protein FIBSPDRAFT_878966 [Fibularhizoctonia sp. CBS 109695]KZP29457.1 hypothetical protein FIBSPDRAFT_851454 [Fibularhizoctonia sp. CBS 109695]
MCMFAERREDLSSSRQRMSEMSVLFFPLLQSHLYHSPQPVFRPHPASPTNHPTRMSNGPTKGMRRPPSSTLSGLILDFRGRISQSRRPGVHWKEVGMQVIVVLVG